MNIKLEKLVAVLFIAILALSAMTISIPPALAQATEVRVDPSSLEFGPASCTGKEFIIDVVVADVNNLYGLDIQFAWDTEYLLYLNHTMTIPVNGTFPFSPHPGGILWMPVVPVTDDVNVGAGTYALAIAARDPAPTFNGTGTAFNMAFKILKQPNSSEPDVILTLDITSSDLSNKAGTPISHTRHDGQVTLHHKSVEYPPLPLLKVSPQLVKDIPVNTTFESSVYLMGEGEVDLDPFWDVAGFDVYMNFKSPDPPYMLIEAVNVTIDPDGWFAAFWPNSIPIFVIETTINNVEGWVHVAFMGLPGPNETHTAPYGQGRIFAVTFKNLCESDTFPPPTVDITLKNPIITIHRFNLHADDGLIDLEHPEGTDWHAINALDYGTPFSIIDWTDINADTKLSDGDHLRITDTSSGLWHDYVVDEVRGTLGALEQQPFPTADDILAMDGPQHKYSPWPKIADTGLYGNGIGNYDWIGNFSCTYPVDSVNYFEVIPQIGASYNLTEGPDFVVNPDGTIELKIPLDEAVINEFVGTMPAVDLGWPALVNIASGLQGVYLVMPNGTSRYARNLGYGMSPPAEYWYDYDFPYEIESWWASGYFPGPWVWPDGTNIYCNYTAAAFIHIDYNAFADPAPYYFEYNGTYAEFLAALADPVSSGWNEIFPSTLPYADLVEWSDEDTSGDVTIGDYVTLETHIGNRTYLVNGVSTDIIVDRILAICDDDLSHEFYGVLPIVEVAGFPRPDYVYCPWHSSDSSVGLPHVVDNGVFVCYFKPPGPWIDLFTQEGGIGPGVPSDMITPQCDLFLYAYVTYNFWPEQNKDVAFEIKDPQMNVWGIFYARTNSTGYAWVHVRLPWPCDNPDQYLGEWHVWATVDVACCTVNDTMNFKYDYLVNIWKVTTDKETYDHCEYINLTITYGTYAMQFHNITITVTAVDETGVPFAWTWTTLIIGGAEYCTYENGTIYLSVHVEKFARAGVAKLYIGALSDFPQNGGSALCPLYTPVPEIGISHHWA